jgi:hypothetical protein
MKTTKKLASLLLAFSLACSLIACGESKRLDTSDTANGELQFALGTPLTKEFEYTDDDGVVLLTEKYELPQLELLTADGVLFEPDDSKSADICRAFNAEMQAAAEQVDASAQEQLVAAQEQYEALDTERRADWTAYVEELTIGTIYQTDGLLSILGNGYVERGGVHPSTYSKTWNFDLTTGEFITFDTLLGEENPLAQTLKDAITSAITNEIDEQGLAQDYFEGYESSISDLSDNASFYFQDSGMIVTFDVYVLAPYAYGPQTFALSYDKFYYALSEHMQSLFDLPQDTVIVSDYLTTQVLWSWFNMSMPPVASETPEFTTEDGVPYYRTALGDVNTMDALRALLCRHVSEELADEWLDGDHFMEKGDVLYVSMGERGSDITIGSMAYIVQLDGESGVLTQTVHRQNFDGNGSSFLTGETEEYIYPFDLVDGHAIFSAFPCPL